MFVLQARCSLGRGDRLLSPGPCTLRRMNGGTNVIDAALRFARSNPELVDCAREGALYSGRSVDDLLLDAVARLRNAVEHRELVDVRPYDSRRRYIAVAK